MKTQVSNLRSGAKNQILNTEVDYSKLPQATSHNGHGGTNSAISYQVWEAVKYENSEVMTIKFLGKKYDLKANWSISKKSVSYNAILPNEIFEEITGFKVDNTRSASISIQSATDIILSNGKNYNRKACPSLIEIL